MMREMNLSSTKAESCTSIVALAGETPAKLELTDTPSTHLNLVGYHSSPPSNNYKSCVNVLFSLLLLLPLACYVLVFYLIARAHLIKGHIVFIQWSHCALGSLAFVFAELGKLCYEAVSARIQPGELFAGRMGAAIFVLVEDTPRILLIWLCAHKCTFASSYSFGLGWIALDLVALLFSYGSLRHQGSFATTSSRTAFRLDTCPQSYAMTAWIQYIFSSAGAIGAAFFIYHVKSRWLALVVIFTRLVAYYSQSILLKQRINRWLSSLLLYAVQATLYGVGLYTWINHIYKPHSSSTKK